MRKVTKKFAAILMISILAVITTAAVKDKRVRLKNGKSKESVTLNPSRTYRFLINAKEFTKLSINLQTKKGKIEVVVKSPSGKILSSGTGKSFTIDKRAKVEKGDYQIILKNRDKSEIAAGYIKFQGIEG